MKEAREGHFRANFLDSVDRRNGMAVDQPYGGFHEIPMHRHVRGSRFVSVAILLLTVLPYVLPWTGAASYRWPGGWEAFPTEQVQAVAGATVLVTDVKPEAPANPHDRRSGRLSRPMTRNL